MDLSDLLPIGFTFKRAELKILYEDSLCRFKRAWGDSTSSLFADILRHTYSSDNRVGYTSRVSTLTQQASSSS